jgi:hypothetical protein
VSGRDGTGGSGLRDRLLWALVLVAIVIGIWLGVTLFGIWTAVPAPAA